MRGPGLPPTPWRSCQITSFQRLLSIHGICLTNQNRGYARVKHHTWNSIPNFPGPNIPC